MSDLSNVERLKKNLPTGSLAQQLVEAHEKAEPAARSEAIKAILRARLEHLRTSLGDI
jgi:metal-responsive CopG/Arc/MetJ family transcriptional regulator